MHPSNTNQPINQSTNQLITYTLHLADNALILGHRNSEWCGHGPVLEQDIAITNISLDLIGQARNFYQYAAQLINQSTSQPINQPATEDTLAYLRDANEFRNIILNELPKGDWAQTILRQFFFSSFQLYFFKELEKSSDDTLAAIATKSLKEVTYHVRWSSEWVIRLGDGTDESNRRINKAIDELWQYTEELFMPTEFEAALAGAGVGVDLAILREPWTERLKSVFEEAQLKWPATAGLSLQGKNGKHSPHLDDLLSEMQHMQRTYPGMEW